MTPVRRVRRALLALGLAGATVALLVVGARGWNERTAPLLVAARAAAVAPEPAASEGPSATPRTSPSGVEPIMTRADLAAIAERRTEAYAAVDRDAFLGDLDPADPALRESEGWLYDGLLDSGASSTWRAFMDPSQESALAPRIGAWVATVHLEERYRLDGIDAVDVSRDHTYLARYVSGRWVLGDDPRLTGHRHGGDLADPWDMTHVLVHRTPMGIVVAPAGEAETAAAAADAMPGAVAAVRDLWPTGWTGKVAVYLTEPGPIERAYFQYAEFADAVAVPVRQSVEDEFVDSRVRAMRVAVSPSLFDLRDEGLASLLRHEIAHVATLDRGRTWAPVWFAEGIAEYTAYRGDPDSRGVTYELLAEADARDITAPLEPETFYDHGWHYDHAWLMCAYIAKHWEEAALTRMLDAYGFLAPGADEQVATERVVSKVLGVDMKEFQDGFADFLDEELNKYS